jgi:ComF family protein
MQGWLGETLGAMAELLFPPDAACALCGGEAGILEGRGVCRDCDAKLPRLGERIDVCSIPAAAAFHYDGDAARMIRGLKYGGKRYLGRTLARYMQETLDQCLEGPFDMMVSVPLYPERKKERGYNQSDILCRHLSALTGIPWKRDALIRVRDTPSQTGLGKQERIQNMRDAFRAGEGLLLEGRRVLAVDDVCTTGATLDACTEALKAAGAAGVSALSAAHG